MMSNVYCAINTSISIEIIYKPYSIHTCNLANRYILSSSEAVVPSMNVFAMVFVAIRDRIFFCARSPMSRARNAFSVMTR